MNKLFDLPITNYDGIEIRKKEIFLLFEKYYPYEQYFQEAFEKIINKELFLSLDEYEYAYFKNEIALLCSKRIYLYNYISSSCYNLLRNLLFCSKYIHNTRKAFSFTLPLFLEYGNYQASKHIKELLFKYDISEDFFQYLNILDLSELEVLVNIGNGKNIRKCNNFKIPLSKKESFYFHHSIGLLYDIESRSNNIMELRAFASKLIKHSPDKMYLVDTFIYLLHKTGLKYSLLIESVQYWGLLFKILPKQIENHELNNIIDYISHHFKESNVVTLKKKSFVSLYREMNEWHIELEKTQMKNCIISWKVDDKIYLEKKIYHKGKEFVYKELTNSYELYLDGLKKHHCVSIYKDQCKSGKSSIWVITPNNENYDNGLTLEVVNKEVIQVAGKYNRTPTEEETEIIKLFSSKEGLRNIIF